MDNSKKEGGIVQLVVVLGLITFICALLLGVINGVTADKINADGTVAGAKVTSHAETPGLGAKSQADPNWITQFAGQTADGQLKVAKDGGTINAITGATITSRAVTDGVNTAAAYVATLG